MAKTPAWTARSVDRSPPGLYPSLSVISPSEHSSALKLNNSVNGNGVSTAKDSDSSFDVEPVCSHVSRITWRGIEVFYV